MVDLWQGAVMVQTTEALSRILGCKDKGTIELVEPKKANSFPAHYEMSFDMGRGNISINVPTEAANGFAEKILTLTPGSKNESIGPNGSKDFNADDAIASGEVKI